MASTYTPISTYTIPSAQSSYTFTTIPSTYTDLVIVISGTTSTLGNIYAQFNGDTNTTTNYSATEIYGNGSTAVSSRYQDYAYCGLMGSSQGNTIINVQNYANSTTYKTFLARSNYPANYVIARVGLWKNTNAVTSILIANPSGYTFQTGSTFTLYGIKAA